MGGLVPEGGNAGTGHGVLHPAADLRLRQPQVHRPKGDIPVHVGREELIVRVLKYQAHPAAQFRQVPPGVRDGLPVQQHLPALRGQHAVEVEKQGGFARPVGAQNAGDLSLLRAEGDTL